MGLQITTMTSRDFAYWLQGFFEISGSESITEEQTSVIKNHLKLVFVHEIDPSMGDQSHQDNLNNIHGNLDHTGLSNSSQVYRC